MNGALIEMYHVPCPLMYFLFKNFSNRSPCISEQFRICAIVKFKSSGGDMMMFSAILSSGSLSCNTTINFLYFKKITFFY